MRYHVYFVKHHLVRGTMDSRKIAIAQFSDRRGAKIFCREMRKVIKRGDRIMCKDTETMRSEKYDYPEL